MPLLQAAVTVATQDALDRIVHRLSRRTCNDERPLATNPKDSDTTKRGRGVNLTGRREGHRLNLRRQTLLFGLLLIATTTFAGAGDNRLRTTLGIPVDTVLPTEVSNDGIASGNTAGALQVSADGDLVYNFPLWLPAGRNGVQPVLSLAYRGRAPNGLLGVGWSVTGLSQITRCAQTTAQNGENAPVAFDNTDRFCHDGQQLYAVNGNYGADNTEYRTERDIFAKVVSGGSDCGSEIADCRGPGWFKIYLKNGRILSYGTTQDSRVEGQRFHSSPASLSGTTITTDFSQTVRLTWHSLGTRTGTETGLTTTTPLIEAPALTASHYLSFDRM
jgi:hypothetical protein